MNQAIKKRIEDINNGIVPEGYKQTPFGIFPCDWETTSIGEVSINKGEYGLNAPACEYESGLPKYIRITDIDANGNYVDTGACVDFQDVTKQYTLKEGDVVFARTGATVGRNYLYKEKDGELLYAGFLIKFSINKNVANPYIIYANSNTKQYWNWIKKISARSGQPGVNAEEYSQYRFVKAKDKVEQVKIAEILMTWDEMIELQEQYIQKLELRKKAIMKKLLTPKDGWEKYKLFELVISMSSGGTPSTKITEYYDGDIVWVSIDDMSRAGKYIAYSARKLTDLGLKNSSAKLFPEQTILYAMYASIGKTVISTVPCATSQAILGIIVNQEKLDNQYLYYYLLNMQDKIVLQGQKGTQANLNKEMVEKFDISLPKDLDEQKNISRILMNLDEEISLQKEKLEKIKIQRKAMQQYLLTGIVRVS